MTSWLTSATRERPPLPEEGPTELSRLLSSTTSLRAEIAELWLERDVGGTSAGDLGRTSGTSSMTMSSDMLLRRERRWREGTRRRRCCVGGCLKRNVSHLPCPFSASFRDFFQPVFRPVDLEFRNSAHLQCPLAQPHMTKQFPPPHLLLLLPILIRCDSDNNQDLEPLSQQA